MGLIYYSDLLPEDMLHKYKNLDEVYIIQYRTVAFVCITQYIEVMVSMYHNSSLTGDHFKFFHN